MDNSNTGIFTDNLNYCEVEFTKKCSIELSKENDWHNFLNDERIKKAINVAPNKNSSFGELISVKSHLFEVRIVFLIHKSGLKSQYEYKPNKVKKKTVDFKVYGDKLNNTNLLLELSSLRESGVQKEKTWENDAFFGCCLNDDDEVSEYFKAQKALVEKAVKFPSKFIQDQFNIILLDMRSSIIECTDCYDYHNILFGSKGLPDDTQRVMKDKSLFPGIFCQTHPGNNCVKVKHLRNSVHCFGFVVEKIYTENELATEIHWFNSPNLNSGDTLNLGEILNGKSEGGIQEW